MKSGFFKLEIRPWIFTMAVIVFGGVLYGFFSYPEWPEYKGLIMEQWLAILSGDTNGPKDIIEVRLYQWKSIINGTRSYEGLYLYGRRELSLTQIITGQEPRLFVFEVPLSYDLLTKNEFLRGERGKLRLKVDGDVASFYDDYARATNGNCLLLWRPYIYHPWHGVEFAPGPHRVRATFYISPVGGKKALFAEGAPIVISLPEPTNNSTKKE